MNMAIANGIEVPLLSPILYKRCAGHQCENCAAIKRVGLQRRAPTCYELWMARAQYRDVAGLVSSRWTSQGGARYSLRRWGLSVLYRGGHSLTPMDTRQPIVRQGILTQPIEEALDELSQWT